jgi:histidinol dehydrogenase
MDRIKLTRDIVHNVSIIRAAAGRAGDAATPQLAKFFDDEELEQFHQASEELARAAQELEQAAKVAAQRAEAAPLSAHRA